MRTENGQIVGDFKLQNSLQLNGQVTGSLIVQPGVELIMNGMICRDLILRPGSRVEVNGTVEGDVTNSAATLHVRGVVNGSVHTNDGQTTVDTNAIVRGEIEGS